MPAVALRSGLPRRIVAVFLILGVLVLTLGLGHPGCDMAQADAASIHGHASHGTGMSHDGAEQPAPHECDGHRSQQTEQGAACAMIAHCGQAFTVPSTVAASESPVPAGLPVALTVLAPPAPAPAPEAPPPKA